MSLELVQSRIATPLRQTCAAGDAIALVVSQLPPAGAGDADFLRAAVDAEFDNDVRHRVGVLIAHPRPRAGARVLGTACVPGARAYHVTWTLDSSRDIVARVGIQQSIGGADYGLRNFDFADDPAAESVWVGGTGLGTEVLLSSSACVAAEVYGHSTVAAYIQIHDTAVPVVGSATLADAFHVPAGATVHRSYPPRLFERGVVVARATTPGAFTPEGTGVHMARARLLVR